MSETLDLLVVGDLLVLDRVAILDELPPIGSTALFSGLNKELEQIHFGGCTANVAAAACALGLTVGLACFAGVDFESSGYCAHLDRLGITSRWLPVLKDQNIVQCYSFYDQQGRKLSFMDWFDPLLSMKLQLPDHVIKNSKRVVIVGGNREGPISDSLLNVAITARKYQVPVALAWAGGVAEIEPRYMELVDMILCNDFELKRILKYFGWDDDRAIFSLGPGIAYISSGTNGSHVYHDGNKVHVPAFERSQAMDPTGAGDSYAGGVLTGFEWGKAPEVCGRIGSIVSSFVVEKKGCQTNLPSHEMLEERYHAAYGEEINASIADR